MRSFATGMNAGSQMVGQFAPLVSAMKTQRQDEIANRLLNEATPPRATAVDPNVDMQAKLVYGDRKPATGGMDELKMRMALQSQENQIGNTQLDNAVSLQRLDLLKQQAKDMEAQREAMRANQTLKNTTQDTQDHLKNALAYNTNLRLNTTLLNKAENEDQYNQAKDTIMSLYQAAKAAKLDVPAPVIPDYVSPEQKQQIAEQQSALDEAQAAYDSKTTDWIPNWFGGDEQAKARVDEEKKKLEGLPGFRPHASSPITETSAVRDPIQQAKDAIAAGADPDKVRQRLQSLGYNASALDQ